MLGNAKAVAAPAELLSLPGNPGLPTADEDDGELSVSGRLMGSKVELPP